MNEPTDSSSLMSPGMMGGGGEDFEKDLGLLLREQRRQDGTDRELNLYRSGSAPPTVEGSVAAGGGAMFARESGMRDEELRSNPAYPSYYYSNVNLNPRLPPPVLSKGDWRFSQRLQPGLGEIGDRRSDLAEQHGNSSLFSLQPVFQHRTETPDSEEWLGKRRDGLTGMQGLSLGRQKSFADMFKDDLGDNGPVSSHPSRPTSRNAHVNGFEKLDCLQSGGSVQTGSSVQNNGVSASHSFTSALNKSLSRSATPDSQRVTRAPSPGLPPVGSRRSNTIQHTNGSSSFQGVSSHIVGSDDLAAVFSSMSLSATGGIEEHLTEQKILFGSQGAQDNINRHPFSNISDSVYLNSASILQFPQTSYTDLARETGGLLDRNRSGMMPNGQVESHKLNASSTNSYMKRPSLTSPVGLPSHLNMDANATFGHYGLSGYPTNPALESTMSNQVGIYNMPLFENVARVSPIGSRGVDSMALGGIPSGSNVFGVSDFQKLNGISSPTAAGGLQMPLVDPLYVQYLRTGEYAAQVGANFGDPSMEKDYMGNSYMDFVGSEKAHLGSFLQAQKQYGMPFLDKYVGMNSGYYSNHAVGLGMSYPGSPLVSSILPESPAGAGGHLRHGERNIRFSSGLRNIKGNLDDGFPSSILEEFKSTKTKCYELSEIVGHVVEFSADQYGSRFIQQKLESATPLEKNMVYEEILPKALSLTTDVFGNYVIQKFFEHGSASQRRELADRLIGNVLTLSLQMYGCRVIQKAIEVVDLDQQIKMVSELDGHIIRCVRDQNGNHVIQKCIECVPQDAIQSIISSFYEQVVSLSTHPYGCRVIQRVLQFCDDPKTQQIMMDEIMGSVCALAQDQFGNYVVQHLLQHGKPHERSAIIKKLAGNIVEMSLQKFASNVIEKCLTFGDVEERRILVNEMLGSTDENEPLQAMMKDQYGNYVVQKVLETCDDAQREHILSRHLNALKKYTYGKHIVARVEKLVAAGERRNGVQSSYTS